MKEQIRNLILSLDADVCGFTRTDRFADAPQGYKPTDISPDCRSVISFGIALPEGLAKVPPRLIYGYYNTFCRTEADTIAFKAAKRMEENYHCIAVPLPCDSPYEYWDNDRMEGRGLLSMKHIAVAAGLGVIGKSTDLTIIRINDEDYICITDLARYKNAEHTDDVIKNWLRNRNTIELLGIWEYIHNPNFKPVIFDGFRMEAGLNSFVMTPRKMK